MPNWCFNQGSISGNKDSIKKFIKDGLQVETLPESAVEIDDLLQSKELSLATWLPRPEIFDIDTTNYPEKFPEAVKEQMEKYGVVGWYDWGLKFYGCKWDCIFDAFQYVENNDNSDISFYFDSPWSPATEWFKNIQEKYPDLDFEVQYIEPGMCFSGEGSTLRDGDDVTFDVIDFEDWTESPLYESLGYDEFIEED